MRLGWILATLMFCVALPSLAQLSIGGTTPVYDSRTLGRTVLHKFIVFGSRYLLCGDNVSDPAVLHNNCLPRLRHHILCAVKYDSANICCLHNLPSKIRLPSRVAGPNCILVIILYYRIYITIPQISSSGDKKSTPGKNRERFGKRLGKRNKAPFRA